MECKLVRGRMWLADSNFGCTLWSFQVSHLFHVSPEPNQDMLPEEKRLYRLAGGDEER